MIGMTGYSYREYQGEEVHFTLELKGYNNRFLDLQIHLPAPLSSLENWFRKELSQKVRRGRVELYLRMQELEEDLSLMVDQRALQTYKEALVQVCEKADLSPKEISLEQLLRGEGVLKVARNRNLGKTQTLLEPLLAEALEEFISHRQGEGERTQRDILKQLTFLEDCLTHLETLAPQMELQFEAQLRRKIQELAGEALEEARILGEVGVQAVRFGINEELQRLRAHMEIFKACAVGLEPVGKKLDFLCQELGREVNTIGSKSSLMGINHLVVDMKDSLEKIREQLRNVE